MSKLAVLNRIRNEGLKTEIYTTALLVEDIEGADAFLEKLKLVANEYLHTDDGLNELEESSFDFNWGDLFTYAPSALFEKHGIFDVNKAENHLPITGTMVLEVEQDEHLFNDTHLEAIGAREDSINSGPGF